MGERKPLNVVEYRNEAFDAGLKASPSGILVIYTQGHKDTPPGSLLAASNVVGGPDHVAVLFNYKGKTYFLEMGVGTDKAGPLLSTNTPGS